MANGVYGTNIPIGIPNESIGKYVDIFYAYSKSRGSSNVDSSEFIKLDASNMKNVVFSSSGDTSNIVEGLYNLKLPSNIFGKKGFYTIYIKPKEVKASIADVSTLKDFSSIRGVVLDLNSLPTEIKEEASANNGLVGYRIIYKDDNGNRQSDFRIITSNNKCEPVVSVNANSSDKNYSYRYNENSTFTFLTVTPSMPLSFKASSSPYIGKSSQNIYLVNTMFEPICIELEMVEHDIETVTTMLEGNQLRDLDNGLITTFNSDGEIYHQAEFSTLKETVTGKSQYEIKINQEGNINYNQTISDKL